MTGSLICIIYLEVNCWDKGSGRFVRLEIWHNQIMRTNSGTTRIEVIVPNLKWHWVAWFTVIVHQLSSEPSMLSCSVPSPIRLLSRGVASGLRSGSFIVIRDKRMVMCSKITWQTHARPTRTSEQYRRVRSQEILAKSTIFYIEFPVQLLSFIVNWWLFCATSTTILLIYWYQPLTSYWLYSRLRKKGLAKHNQGKGLWSCGHR